jgi:hypothetical protein
LKRDNEKDGLIQLKEMSRYDIKNALTEKYMPLSDMVHGPYFMMPPETLHTSGSGIIKKYIRIATIADWWWQSS